MAADAYSHRRATQRRHSGGWGLLDAHTNASQLPNSVQHTLTSPRLAQGGALSSVSHVFISLKTVTMLLISTLQLFKQVKGSYGHDSQEFFYKGESW